MRPALRKTLLTSLFASFGLLLSTQAGAAVDADAAKALAKKNDCFKCHALDKTKKGPSYKKIASEFRAKPDAEAKLYKHLTTSPKVKLEDGTEEEHKALDASPAEIKNLIGWILQQ